MEPEEPDLPDPVLAEKDPGGSVKRLSVTSEQAAVSAVAAGFSEERAAKLREQLSVRRAVVEGIVLQNLDVALRTRDVVSRIDSVSLEEIRAVANQREKLRIRPELPKFLEARGALTAKESQRALRASTQYQRALREELNAQLAVDPENINLAIDKGLRQSLPLATMEAMQALDGMLDRVAADPAKALAACALDADLKNGFVSAVTSASPGAARRDAVHRQLAALPPDQAAVALETVHVPPELGAATPGQAQPAGQTPPK